MTGLSVSEETLYHALVKDTRLTCETCCAVRIFLESRSLADPLDQFVAAPHKTAKEGAEDAMPVCREHAALAETTKILS